MLVIEIMRLSPTWLVINVCSRSSLPIGQLVQAHLLHTLAQIVYKVGAARVLVVSIEVV